MSKLAEALMSPSKGQKPKGRTAVRVLGRTKPENKTALKAHKKG